MGFETPSPIQAQALPILLGEPSDFIGLAATGTGKTAAFGIPLLERIDRTQKHTQALIMCPTRELALQVTGQINLLGKYKGIKALPVYGGSDYLNQIHGLKNGAQIVVGTPGRLIDHMDRGNLKLDKAKIIIMDEADEMISMGFREDLEKILGAVQRESSHIWLFSATMSKEVRRVADKFLKNPKLAQVNRTEMLSTTVEQIYYRMKESDKPEILARIIESVDDFYGLVFCQTKAMVTDLTTYLIERGLKVDCLHGDKDQRAREKSMQSFRDRRVRLLVCTDVASRGLDVKDITHVINYSLPRESELYIHRIGRTARGGKTGIAMSLVTPSHQHLVARLEHITKTKIKEGKLPSRKEVASLAISKMLPKFKDQKFSERAIELLSEEWKETLANLSVQEVAARFLVSMSPELFDDRPTSKPLLRVSQEAEQRPRQENSRRSERRFGGKKLDHKIRNRERDNDGNGERGERTLERSADRGRGERSFKSQPRRDRKFSGNRFEGNRADGQRPPKKYEHKRKEDVKTV